MKPLILALAIALPPYVLEQKEIAHKISQAFDLAGKDKEKFLRLYDNTLIQKRYSVLEDFQKPVGQWSFWGNDFPQNLPSTYDRNQIYRKQAPELALEAARKVILNWGGKKDDITHVINVSCTGMMAPGIELLLSKALALRPEVKRFGINFMGCFGAFRALEAAYDIVRSDKSSCVLITCVELCSLHMQLSTKPEVLIGNALFGDGAAAVIVGGQAANNRPLWEIKKFSSKIIDDSLNNMTWKIGQEGFVMKLSREVPSAIKNNIALFSKQILNNHNKQDIFWAIHPGGRKIVEDIEEVMELNSEQTESSWNVLKNYGNMSSATFLFVLNDLIEQANSDPAKEKNKYKYTLGLGFGPGLSCESIFLKNLF